MRELIKKIGNKKAEALIESVISILVFSLLMLAITTMLMGSLRITGSATQQAANMQNLINDVAKDNYTGTPSNVTFKLVNHYVESQPVTLINNRNILAFKPEPKPVTP